MTAQLKKKMRPSIFQVLLLNNDASEDVEVQEAKQVDFFQVNEHLKSGGSVFITSKNSQKVFGPKTKSKIKYNESRKNCSFLFRQQMRSS